MLVNIICVFLILCCTVYLVIIGMLTYGWLKLKTYIPSGKQPKTKISIIIPARNEEKNIANCLNDLLEQNYPNEMYEIIVIDDDSDDDTFKTVESFIDSNIKETAEIILIRNDNSGKKEAIRTGIKHSSGELIITSDADCRFKPKWLSIIVDYFENNDIKLITGPVSFHASNNLFKSIQSLEFLSLIASAAGFAQIGKPILGNASNLAFLKSAWLEADAYRTDYDLASGDDIFLISHINGIYGAEKVHFLKNYGAIVTTEPMSNLKDFFSQRIRWVSKGFKIHDPFSTLVAWITFLFNLSLVGGFIIGIFYPQYLLVSICLFMIKLIVDLPVMVGITHFTKRKALLWFFLPLEIINLVYVPVIAVISSFFKTMWKERKV